MSKNLPASQIATVPVYHCYSHPRYGPHDPGGESRTVQAAASQFDINNIVKRMLLGQDPGVPLNSGEFRDNSGIVDMKTNLDVIRRHQSAFQELPEEVRARYNTPGEFYNATQAALEKELKEQQPLDVSVPTDSKAVKTQTRSKHREATPNESKGREKDFQKSDRDESEE